MQAKPEKAIFAEVRFFFSDPTLHGLLDDAENAIDRADSAPREDRKVRKAELEIALDNVMAALEGEIRKTSK